MGTVFLVWMRPSAVLAGLEFLDRGPEGPLMPLTEACNVGSRERETEKERDTEAGSRGAWWGGVRRAA